MHLQGCAAVKVVKMYPAGSWPRVRLKDWVAQVQAMDMECAEVETSWMVQFQLNGEVCRTTKCNLHTDVEAYEFVRAILKLGAECVMVWERRNVLIQHSIEEDDDACGELVDRARTEMLTARQSPTSALAVEVDELVAGSKSTADFDKKYGALEHRRYVQVENDE